MNIYIFFVITRQPIFLLIIDEYFNATHTNISGKKGNDCLNSCSTICFQFACQTNTFGTPRNATTGIKYGQSDKVGDKKICAM